MGERYISSGYGINNRPGYGYNNIDDSGNGVHYTITSNNGGSSGSHRSSGDDEGTVWGSVVGVIILIIIIVGCCFCCTCCPLAQCWRNRRQRQLYGAQAYGVPVQGGQTVPYGQWQQQNAYGQNAYGQNAPVSYGYPQPQQQVPAPQQNVPNTNNVPTVNPA